MKRLVTLGMALALAAGSSGCMDLNEKLVSSLGNGYVRTPAGITAATNAIYSQLRGYYGREQQMAISDMGTDLWTNGDQVGGSAQQWDYFANYNSRFNGQDGYITATWNNNYVQIGRANLVLDEMADVPVGPELTQDQKNSRLGEAHFLRALAYFDLVQLFGDVTLNLHDPQGNITTEAKRDSAGAVYRAIIADLDSAITLLPVSQPEWGRVRKGAAQHLLAKVYLTRGYKAYGQGQQDFQRALDMAKTVINSGTYQLTPVYADLWCGTHVTGQPADPNRQGFCNFSNYNEQNREFIFTVQYTVDPTYYLVGFGNYLHLSYLSRYDGDSNIGAGLTRDVNNGRPFRRIRPTPYLFTLFDQTRWAGTPGQSDIMDTRFDGSFQTLWFANTAAPGGNSTGYYAGQVCPNCTSGAPISVGDTALWMPGYAVGDAFRRSKPYAIIVPCSLAPTEQCGQDNLSRRIYGYTVGPTIKKWQDNGRGGVSDQDGGKDVIVMRLGETYLIAAEAAFKLGQNTDAAGYINVLRTRAASASHKTDPKLMVSAADITLDFIMDERAREMAGEANRYQDLIRPGGQYFVDRTSKYNPDARANLRAFHALRPIPQSQVNGVTGTAYPQNAGY